MKRKAARGPMMGKKQLRQRRTIVRELVSRLESLQDELLTCTSMARRGEIVAELRHLRRKQKRLSLIREKKVEPLPSSFVERIKASREATARLSGRERIKARFVQGGAPGAGK